jgi:hypothetical protein
MSITNKVYSSFIPNALKGLVSDLSSAGTTVKAALVTSSYSFNQETHSSYADVTNEVSSSGTGYTTGGAAVTGKTVTEAARVTTFDGDDVSWAGATLTARGAVIYDATPSGNTNKKAICFIDFGADYTATNGTFTIAFDAAGILTVTVAA